MASQHKHNRDDKRSRWEEQAQHWRQQRDEDDKPPPVPDSEPVPIHTTH